jgi:hypothetical protein
VRIRTDAGSLRTGEGLIRSRSGVFSSGQDGSCYTVYDIKPPYLNPFTIQSDYFCFDKP